MKITQNVREYAKGLESKVTPSSGDLKDNNHRIKQVNTELVGQAREASLDEVRQGMAKMTEKYHSEGRQLYKEV